jgi:drug/metabolite transporter (DMT)-like permease
MSDTAFLITLLVALALASYSVRLLIYAPPTERPKRAALLGASALLGVLVVGWADTWASWPAGVIIGLAVVELGAVVLRRVRREVDTSPSPRGDSDPSARARDDAS